MSIEAIMTYPVTTVDMDDPISLVGAHFDSGGFHHLPVVNSRKKIKGIVSDRDYLKVISPFLNTPDEARRDLDLMRRHVHTIMSRAPKTVLRSATLGEAAKILVDNGFSSLLVINPNETLAGIVTWKDFLRCISQEPNLDVVGQQLVLVASQVSDEVRTSLPST